MSQTPFLKAGFLKSITAADVVIFMGLAVNAVVIVAIFYYFG